jgi:hypothetical protein
LPTGEPARRHPSSYILPYRFGIPRPEFEKLYQFKKSKLQVGAVESQIKKITEQVEKKKITPQEGWEKVKEMEQKIPSDFLPSLRESKPYLTIKAKAEIERLASLPTYEERKNEWMKIKKEDPALVKRMLEIDEEERKDAKIMEDTGLSIKFLKSLPLDERVYAIMEHILKLPTYEERKRVYSELKKAGVITKEFLKRSKELGY